MDTNNNVTDVKTLPLKWHKCLIYFLLWLGVILTLLSAFTYLTGLHYGDKRDVIYNALPSLQIAEIVYGIVLIAFSIFQVYVRFQLAGFKKNAPKKLLIFGVTGGLIGIIFMLIINSITGLSFTSQIISSIIGTIIFFVVNKKYYDKRKDLFVN